MPDVKKAEEQKADNSFLEENAGDGLEVFTSKDLAVPFIWILQKGNPQVEEQNPAYVEGAKAGMFINSFTRKLYAPPLKVIPLYYEPVWLVYGADRGPFKGRKTPGSIKVFGSPFDEGGMKDIDGNEVREAMVYYCLLLDDLKAGPVVVSLKSTDIPHAKDWNSLINNTILDNGERAPFYSSVWSLGLEYNKATKNGKEVTWYALGTKGNTSVLRERYITKDEYVEFVKDNRALIVSGQKKADFQLESGAAPAQIEDQTVPY